MFKTAPMVRLLALVLERDARDVLQTLGHLGVIQLTRASAEGEPALLVTRNSSNELSQWQRIAVRVQELRGTLEATSHSDIIEMPAGLSLAEAEAKLATMEQDVEDLLIRRRQVMERLRELKTVDGRLATYRGLELPLDQSDEASFLHFVTGSLPPESFARLQSEISESVALLSLPEHDGRLPLVVMTTRRNRPALEEMLQQAGFHREVLPAVRGATVDTLAVEDWRAEEQLNVGLQQVQRKLSALAEKCSQPLAELAFIAENECRLLEAGQNFAHSESAVLLAGWVPRVNFSALANRLRERTSGRCVIEMTEPRNDSEEEIPVLLRHPRWLRPFEMLVTAYGLPQYRELEPTLFVALSYLLMFGVMFGDVGHGAILALAGLLLMWRGGKVGVRSLGQLLLFAGFFSMIFGLLYGSYFGLPAFKQFALWHDPLEGNPMNLMVGAIGFGVILISLGLVLNVLNRWRHGDFWGGLLGRFGLAGAVFYWGSLLLLTQYGAIESRGLKVPAVIAFLALPVVGWTIKEPLEFLRGRRCGKPVEPGNSLFASFTESLVGVFEAVLSYFANTVSFVRLAAYAMSHAALLMAAFLMADAVKHTGPAGGLLAVLVIILGNAVAILLEGVVASVQALRLEYYEFFGKFFAGNGRPFKPFQLQTTTVANSPFG